MFDGTCLRTQNAKIRTCWSLPNNKLVSVLWKRDWGCSWVGMEIVPDSAASPPSDRRENVNNKAICYFRCQDGTADNYQLTLQPHEWRFEDPSSKLCCFASLLMISQRPFFFFFWSKGAVFNEQPIKVCRRLNIQWHTDIVGNSPANTVGLLSSQESETRCDCNRSCLLTAERTADLKFGFISQKWPCFINSPQLGGVKNARENFKDIWPH